MMLSFVLIANWKNILNLRFPLMNGELKVIIFTQILCLLYGVYDVEIDFQYISFFLYVIAFSLALASIDFYMSFEELPQYLFYISLLSLSLGVYVCFNALVVGENVWYLKQENEEYALEPFNVSYGALSNMFAGLCWNKDKKHKKILFVVSMIAGTYIILSCGKRTPYFVFWVCFIYYIYLKRKISRVSITKFIISIIGIVFVCLIAYIYVPFFYKHINSFGYNMIAGVYNLFGDTSIRDEMGSAYMRVENRIMAYDYIDKKFSIVNYFFGGGFNCINQIDNPLLQSYVEMGILGMLLYVYIIVVVPLKISMKFINDNSLVLTILLSVYSIASIINSGNPYMWSRYVPVCLLIIVFHSVSIKHTYYTKK